MLFTGVPTLIGEGVLYTEAQMFTLASALYTEVDNTSKVLAGSPHYRVSPLYRGLISHTKRLVRGPHYSECPLYRGTPKY